MDLSLKEGNDFEVPLPLQMEGSRPLRLIWIWPGHVQLGVPTDHPKYDPVEDVPSFKVTLTKGYWIGECPITVSQWASLMGSGNGAFSSPDLPVTDISWFLAMEFCGQLNSIFTQLMGLESIYRFSLPTEAQWVHACRASSTTTYYTGDTLDDLSRAAWFAENSSGQAQEVGQRAANPWKLYDMLGNVSEWCYDTVDTPPSNPEPDWYSSFDTYHRIVKGGSYATSRVSTLFYTGTTAAIEPWQHFRTTGFRIVLTQLF